jgi:hypothetical protein
LYNVACSLTGCSGSAGNKVPPLVKTNGSERDKPNVVQTGHNPFNSTRHFGVCLSPRSALDRTSKDDPKRSGLAVRASQCTGGYNKTVMFGVGTTHKLPVREELTGIPCLQAWGGSSWVAPQAHRQALCLRSSPCGRGMDADGDVGG